MSISDSSAFSRATGNLGDSTVPPWGRRVHLCQPCHRFTQSVNLNTEPGDVTGAARRGKIQPGASLLIRNQDAVTKQRFIVYMHNNFIIPEINMFFKQGENTANTY